MNHLLRDLAPFGDSTWELLDGEAQARLTVALAGRKLVDFSGPHGWAFSSVAVGRTTPVDAGPLTARTRRVLPLSEVRAGFALSREELTDFSRGATDVDLTPLDLAALRLAEFENRVIVHGWEAAGIVGAAAASTHPAATHDNSPRGFRAAIATAASGR